MNKNNISEVIHSIELNAGFASISTQTINQFRNAQNRNITFQVKKPRKDITIIKIRIADIKRCNVTSFVELRDFVEETILKIANSFDRKTMQEQFKKGHISISRIDVFSRVDYSTNQSVQEQFATLKSYGENLRILIPNIKSIVTRNENSMYFNFKNGKTLVVYDEIEKRNILCVKAELRINNSNNLKAAFRISEKGPNALKINNWHLLDVGKLLLFFNSVVNKIDGNISTKKRIKNNDAALVRRIFRKFDENECGYMLAVKIDEYIKKENEKIINSRKSAYYRAKTKFRFVEESIHKVIQTQYPHIFAKLYPTEEIEGSFFQRRRLPYSYIITFVDFRSKKYSMFGIGCSNGASYKTRGIPDSVKKQLSLEEMAILKDITLARVDRIKHTISRKYSKTRMGEERAKSMDESRCWFETAKVAETGCPINMFSSVHDFNLPSLRLLFDRFQNMYEGRCHIEYKTKILSLFQQFRFCNVGNDDENLKTESIDYVTA